MSAVHVLNADCLAALRDMPDASVDAVVTDPPYGLSNTTPAQVADTITRWVSGDREYLPSARGFMGHEWDGFVPPVAVWDECLRVLKPGGHLLAFAGSRTHDLMTLGIRLAGFEIRDSVAWLYGSGFSKAGLLGNKKGVKWCECGGNALPYDHASNTDLPRLRNNVHPSPVPRREGEDPGLLSPVQREAAGRGMEEARTQGPGVVDGGVAGIVPAEDDRRPEPSLEGRLVHRTGQGVPDDPQAGAPSREGERVCGGASARDGGDDRASGHVARGGASHQPRQGGQPTGEPEAVPGSHVALDDGALRGRAECPRCGGLDPAYRGFSPALKPAFEPVTLARKPLTGTVAANVQEHGTGALNVDACRVGDGSESQGVRSADEASAERRYAASGGTNFAATPGPRGGSPSGRWPANVVLDESQAAELDRQSGARKSSGVYDGDGSRAGGHRATNFDGGHRPNTMYADTGGASRFMYVAKAPKSERPVVDGTAHPTVKPLALMRWLVRMVTPPGGVVLDPFAGSGTTLEAAMLEGFNVTGIEREADYLPLIQARIDRATAELEARAEAEGDTLFPIDGAAS